MAMGQSVVIYQTFDSLIPPTASGGPLEGLGSGAPENLLIFGVVLPRAAMGLGDNNRLSGANAYE